MNNAELLTWAHDTVSTVGGTLYIDGEGDFSATVKMGSNGIVRVTLG